MILIYTGNGKGKTSACVGQALRALGQGLNVAFAQFMKKDVQAGEQRLLAELLGDTFYIGGTGFFTNSADFPMHREAAQKTLDWIHKNMPLADMMVLDEALYALKAELILKVELEELLLLAQKHNVHLVLSGRGMPDWLCEKADTVTSMEPVKHAYEQGIAATKGIEY